MDIECCFVIRVSAHVLCYACHGKLAETVEPVYFRRREMTSPTVRKQQNRVWSVRIET